MKQLALLGILLLTACVTINIYFPAAAAEKAADEIIKDIQDIAPEKIAPKPKAALTDWQIAAYHLLEQAMDTLVPAAHADGADLSIDSADVRQIRAAMETRFTALQPNYAAGYIGIQADGFLVIRNIAAIPLQNRNLITKLVAAENADRQKLYQAIANANGHPEWSGQIKTTFASRWASNAQPGWWYQTSNGIWKQR
ncbi:MAG: YdbL family protein [Methylovulum sp.]|nr:YdbL family protein [Methylovulum sp.]